MSVTSNAVATLLMRLGRVFGPRLRTDAEALALVAGDESGLPSGQPAAVVWPQQLDEVVLLAREAAELAVAVVPRGGGTGKAGGCIAAAGEVVVDFSRMNRLRELRPQDSLVVVEPGLVTQALQEAVAAERFFYPPDPGSFESCTLGGNIATNAGGMRAVKYGVTQRYVWGLEVVLAGGDVLRLGRRSLKGVAGYDLTSLMVGSEGTLGFITEATLQIIPAPAAVETAWLSFSDPRRASLAGERIFAAGFVPRTMELLDPQALAAVRPVSGVRFADNAGACLLLETDGAEQQAREELLRLCEIATDAGALDSAIATKEKDREGMRRTRRLVSSTLKERFPFKLSDDIAVPRSRMVELLDRAGELTAGTGVTVSAYGHLGDGNLHLNLLCASAEERQRAAPLRRELLRLTVALGGTISGEHGIGLSKRDELTLEQSVELLAMQRRLKLAFDPRGIMNPGKVLPASP